MNSTDAWRFLAIIFLGAISSAGISAESPSRKLLDGMEPQIEKAFKGQIVTLRRLPGLAGKLHVEVDEKKYVLEIKPGALFPIVQDLPNVEITKVQFSKDSEVVGQRDTDRRGGGGMVVVESIRVDSYYWKFILRHRHLGQLEIRVTEEDGELPQSADHVREVLSYFLAGTGFSSPVIFRGNTDSRLLHTVASGHSPSGTNAVPFVSAEEGQKQGYSPCPLCFNRLMYLANLGTELALGREMQAGVRHYYPVLPEGEMQQRVERVGRRILEDWPLKLRGYTYSFRILESGAFAVTACPGGSVFIHRGLLEGIESDEELEALLVHEIAHVELRHGLMEYLKAVRDANTAAAFAILAGIGAGAAAAANNGNAQLAARTVADFATVLGLVAAKVSMSGYTKEHELIADALAILYFEKTGRTRAPVAAMLRKVRTADDIHSSLSSESFRGSLHADIKERLLLAEELEIRPIASSETYEGQDRDGQRVYLFSPIAQALFRKRSGSATELLLVEVQAGAALGEPKSFPIVRFRNGQNTSTFSVDGKTTLFPLDGLSVVLTRSGPAVRFTEGGFLPQIEGIPAGKTIKGK